VCSSFYFSAGCIAACVTTKSSAPSSATSPRIIYRNIYTALHEIAKRQGIDLPETPMVRFVDLNGQRRRS